MLSFIDPLSITEIRVKLNLQQATLTNGCTTSDQRTQVGNIIIMANFNDGSSTGTGDRTGDHFVVMQSRRTTSSSPPPPSLTVTADLFRCGDAACNFANLTEVAFSDVSTTPQIGTPFVLLLDWDQANKQYLATLGANQPVSLGYSVSDAKDAVLPLAEIGLFGDTGGCAGTTRSEDGTTSVLSVKTNESAVIP